MAGGEIAAVFKGLAEDTAQAGKNFAEKLGKLTEEAFEKERTNLANYSKAETKNMQDLAATSSEQLYFFQIAKVKRPGGVPVNEWTKKTKVLAEASDRGALAHTPSVRDKAVTTDYRQDLIRRVWSQFATQNRPFAESLIKKLTDGKTIHMDHKIDLQLGGRDDTSNIGPLFGRVNTSVGSQIGNQLRDTPYGTPIFIYLSLIEP
jgi:hypothetical protein